VGLCFPSALWTCGVGKTPFFRNFPVRYGVKEARKTFLCSNLDFLVTLCASVQSLPPSFCGLIPPPPPFIFHDARKDHYPSLAFLCFLQSLRNFPPQFYHSSLLSPFFGSHFFQCKFRMSPLPALALSATWYQRLGPQPNDLFDIFVPRLLLTPILKFPIFFLLPSFFSERLYVLSE